ncbi:unnamed protein product [Absidia cylindrospora]
MHFSSLAGFDDHPRYSQKNKYGSGVLAMKAYPTFKHRYYHRNTYGSRHTKLSRHLIDLWNADAKSNTFFVSTVNFIFIIILTFFFVRTSFNSSNTTDRCYGARLELTLNYHTAIEKEDVFIPSITNAFTTHSSSHSTSDLCRLLEIQSSAVKEVAWNLKMQGRDRYARNQLSLVALMTVVSSCLLSRGLESSQHHRLVEEYFAASPIWFCSLIPLKSTEMAICPCCKTSMVQSSTLFSAIHMITCAVPPMVSLPTLWKIPLWPAWRCLLGLPVKQPMSLVPLPP